LNSRKWPTKGLQFEKKTWANNAVGYKINYDIKSHSKNNPKCILVMTYILLCRTYYIIIFFRHPRGPLKKNLRRRCTTLSLYIYILFFEGEVDIITTSSGKGRFGCFTLVTIKNRGYLGLERGALENGSAEDIAPHYEKKNIFPFSFRAIFA